MFFCALPYSLLRIHLLFKACITVIPSTLHELKRSYWQKSCFKKLIRYWGKSGTGDQTVLSVLFLHRPFCHCALCTLFATFFLWTSIYNYLQHFRLSCVAVLKCRPRTGILCHYSLLQRVRVVFTIRILIEGPLHTSWCFASFFMYLVCFCRDHFVMVRLNLSTFFLHFFSLNIFLIYIVNFKKKTVFNTGFCHTSHISPLRLLDYRLPHNNGLTSVWWVKVTSALPCSRHEHKWASWVKIHKAHLVKKVRKVIFCCNFP